MRCAVFVLALVGCGAQPSRWEPRLPRSGPKIACTCDGVERGPKPDEASSDDDARIVTAVCEGKVHDCGPSRGRSHNSHRLLD